jgi:hypothetical protein
MFFEFLLRFPEIMISGSKNDAALPMIRQFGQESNEMPIPCVTANIACQ